MDWEATVDLTAALREKAERHLVYPLNRDECLALVRVAEAAENLAGNDYLLGQVWDGDGTPMPDMDAIAYDLGSLIDAVNALWSDT
jgi:hypothetical protein